MTPKTLTLHCGPLRSKSIGLRTMSSNVPNVPATEEGQGPQDAIVDCVAFFYEEGKGGENFRKKNKFRCKKNKKKRGREKPTH